MVESVSLPVNQVYIYNIYTYIYLCICIDCNGCSQVEGPCELVPVEGLPSLIESSEVI